MKYISNKIWVAAIAFIISQCSLKTNLLALDLQLVAKIPVPTNDVFSGVVVVGYKDNGSVLLSLSASGFTKSVGLCVSQSGFYHYFSSTSWSGSTVTNLFKVEQDGGKAIIYIDEIISSSDTSRNGILLLKTLSNKGYLSDALTILTVYTNRYKIVNGVLDAQNVVGISRTASIRIQKVNSNGAAINEKTINVDPEGGTFMSNIYPMLGSPGTWYDVNSNNHMLASVNDGFVEVYRLVDDELLPSNAIFVSDSKTNLTAYKFINGDRLVFEIQSSTNLTEWKTIKTTAGEKYSNLFLSADGNHEFLRVLK